MSQINSLRNHTRAGHGSAYRHLLHRKRVDPLLGAFVLATHSRVSRYGWLAYLGANVAMTAFAAAIGAHGLLIQQLGFTITTLLGLYRSGLVALRNDDR